MPKTITLPPKVEVLPPERETIDPVLEQLSDWMDTRFEIPGIKVRFGLDALLGLIPGVGDAATFLTSCYILSAAARYGVPRITLWRMGLNVITDLVVGCIPLVGDVFDVAWKANTRNVQLLKRELASTPQSQRERRRGDWLIVGGMVVGLFVVLVVAITIAWFLAATAFAALQSLFS